MAKRSLELQRRNNAHLTHIGDGTFQYIRPSPMPVQAWNASPRREPDFVAAAWVLREGAEIRLPYFVCRSIVCPQPHLQEEEDRVTQGFVHLETGMARGYWQELQRWEVQPADGDVSRDQAVEMAIAYLENGERLGIPEVYKDRAELEVMPHRAYLSMVEGDEHPTVWFVYFWEKEDNDAVYVTLNVSNGELLGASESYISSDSWSAYGVEPVL